MGGQQTRLLLCSAAAVGLVVGSLFFMNPIAETSGSLMLIAGIILAIVALYFVLEPKREEDDEVRPIIAAAPRASTPRIKSPTSRPPLPEAPKVPDDQIPVAPESGLVIRKKPVSVAPPAELDVKIRKRPRGSITPNMPSISIGFEELDSPTERDPLAAVKAATNAVSAAELASMPLDDIASRLARRDDEDFEGVVTPSKH